MAELLTRVPRVREVDSSFPKRPVKSYTVLQTFRHHFNIYASSCVAFGAMTQRWAPPTRYTLRRNMARIMKGIRT